MRDTPVVAAPTVFVATGTHVGQVRANNEDRVYADPERGSFAVIDGVGGQAAGEFAAETALDTIRQRLQLRIGTPAERVREAIALANDQIYQQAQVHPDRRGMACVLTLVLLQNGTLTAGHVGDTRLYKMRGGLLRKLTHDHSPIGEREDRGELTESEAMRHPRRNEVYREVGAEPRGPDEANFIEVIEEPFESDAALLLCSDGLTDVLSAAAIAGIIERHAGDPSRIVDRLIERANEAGGKDNISVVYIEGAAFVAHRPTAGREASDDAAVARAGGREAVGPRANQSTTSPRGVHADGDGSAPTRAGGRGGSSNTLGSSRPVDASPGATRTHAGWTRDGRGDAARTDDVLADDVRRDGDGSGGVRSGAAQPGGVDTVAARSRAVQPGPSAKRAAPGADQTDAALARAIRTGRADTTGADIDRANAAMMAREHADGTARDRPGRPGDDGARSGDAAGNAVGDAAGDAADAVRSRDRHERSRDDVSLESSGAAHASPSVGGFRAAIANRVVVFVSGLLLGVAIALGVAYAMRDVLIPPTPPTPGPRTLVVDTSGAAAFRTIGQAMNAARPGDTIHVGAGEYREQVVVADGVSLIARAPRETVLRAPAQALQPFTAVIVSGTRHESRVSGFRIAGDAQAPLTIGVHVLGRAALDDLEVSGASLAGIELAGGAMSLTSSAVHDNAGAGVAVKGGDARLAHNVLLRNGAGLPAAATGDVTLSGAPHVTFVGNVFGGDPAQRVRGLPTDQLARVRDSNIVLPPPPSAPAARPRAGAPRRAPR